MSSAPSNSSKAPSRNSQPPSRDADLSYRGSMYEEGHQEQGQALTPSVWNLAVKLYNEPFDPQDAAKVYDKPLLDFDETELTADTFMTSGHRILFFDSNRQKEDACRDKDIPFHPHEKVCSWSDIDYNDAILYEIVSKDVCRRFLREIDKQSILKKVEDIDNSIAQLHTICEDCIQCKPGPLTMIGARDFARSFLVLHILKKIKFDVHPNTQWMAVQCLLHVCPIVEAGVFPPLFSVEKVGRDGWVLTTYAPKPLRHVMFPGVALRMRSETGLLYTVELQQQGGDRRLSMLGVSAQV